MANRRTIRCTEGPMDRFYEWMLNSRSSVIGTVRRAMTMRTFFSKACVALGLYLLVVSPTHGTAGDRLPPRLDTLVATSHHIVVANVSDVAIDPDRHAATAKLTVDSTLKGRVETKILDLVFATSLVAPPTACFGDGDRVVAFVMNPITGNFVDRKQDPFAPSDKFDRLYKGKYRMPFGDAGMRVLSDDDLAGFIKRIAQVARPKTIRTQELHRIDNFVNQNVEISGRYSNDGALSGLLIQRFHIPINFTGIGAPNNHEVTVTGLLKRSGRSHRLDHATWKFPDRPVKVHHSAVQLRELNIAHEDDPFRNDDSSDAPF